MEHVLIGRDSELRGLGVFLERIERGPAALVLEGEPGIGKTVLWREAVRAAESRSFRVLACSPSGSEVRLSFAALGDLAVGAAEEALPELPSPQRRALETALALVEPGEPPNERVLGIAFRNVLAALARQRPLLLAVDDLQWVDAPSADTLTFALRRVDERVGLLATVRLEPRTPAPIDLGRVFPEESLHRLRLRPLSVAGLHELLRVRIGLTLSRPLLIRVHEASGGNPFYALELGRELSRLGGDVAPGRPLPVPESLHQLLRSRLSRLPARTRAVLLAAASLSRPTVALLEAAARDGERFAADLDRATRAGVIEVEGTRVRFSHPLLASVLYENAPRRRRQVLHRRLSEVVADAEERARHLALASDRPDAEVASALDEAAERAATRGAPGAAAELAELAVRMTPVHLDAQRRRRTLQVAEHLCVGGDFARARPLLERLLGEVPAGIERADVLFRLADTSEEDIRQSTKLWEQALCEAGPDDRLASRIESWLAAMRLIQGDVRGALERARRALSRAERAAEPRFLASALAGVGLIETFALDVTPGLLERGVELEERLERATDARQQHPFLESPGMVLGLRLLCADEFDGARFRFEAAFSKAVERGDEEARALALHHLAQVEWRAGNWLSAAASARSAVEASEQLGVGKQQTRGVTLAGEALVLAHLGSVDEARAAAEESVAISGAVHDAIHAVHGLGVLGFLELSLGRFEAADCYLRPLPLRLVSMGWNEPTYFPIWPDAIEALIAIGELEQAWSCLLDYEQRAGRSGSPWASSSAARCRGILSAAGGELEKGLAAFESALSEDSRMAGSFGRGRTLLAIGATHRRARRKRPARESLEAALAIFEELGAPLWADKARAELARISGRPPASKELTETERRVAELVAEGRSNKEVAARLYVSVHTVDAHLTRIYRKLGLRNRAELAHRLAPPTGGAPKV